ncbi:MAG: hypothetical protein R3D67_21500 [Hyphomicrobiaceae bacterium]
MQTRSNSNLRTGLRDMLIGGLAFVVVSLGVSWAGGTKSDWTVSQAAAGEIIASRAIDVTAPAGPQAENAVVAAAQLRPAADPLLARRISELAVMGLTFSLLFAFNMAFWRHLQRVNAMARQGTHH